MSTSTIIMLAIILGFFAWRLIPVKGVRNITTVQLKNELNDKNKQYIDVRSSMEFKGRSIKGFKNIPLDQLSNRAATLSTEKEVIVICQSGMRSARAAKILKNLGFKHITNVKGGLSAWN